jgi:hypothetical protein
MMMTEEVTGNSASCINPTLFRIRDLIGLVGRVKTLPYGVVKKNRSDGLYIRPAESCILQSAHPGKSPPSGSLSDAKGRARQ